MRKRRLSGEGSGNVPTCQTVLVLHPPQGAHCALCDKLAVFHHR